MVPLVPSWSLLLLDWIGLYTTSSAGVVHATAGRTIWSVFCCFDASQTLDDCLQMLAPGPGGLPSNADTAAPSQQLLSSSMAALQQQPTPQPRRPDSRRDGGVHAHRSQAHRLPLEGPPAVVLHQQQQQQQQQRCSAAERYAMARSQAASQHGVVPPSHVSQRTSGAQQPAVATQQMRNGSNHSGTVPRCPPSGLQASGGGERLTPRAGDSAGTALQRSVNQLAGPGLPLVMVDERPALADATNAGRAFAAAAPHPIAICQPVQRHLSVRSTLPEQTDDEDMLLDGLDDC
jgi:hypothetical protein